MDNSDKVGALRLIC